MNKRTLKYSILLLFICLLITIIWYVQSRVFASARAVRYTVTQTTQPAAQPGRPNSIRVGAWNIAHARGSTPGASNWTGRTIDEHKQYLSRIAEQIQTSGVDIMVLNEVDFSASWSLGINQARFIAKKAGFDYCVEQRGFDASFPFYSFCFGNAILSKYPIYETQFVKFKALSNLERILFGNHDSVLAGIETPIGNIHVLALHLEYRSEDVRVGCAEKIQRIASGSQLPIIAMGDFNSAPSRAHGHQRSSDNRNAVDILLKSGAFLLPMKMINLATYKTFPSGAPDRAIDWILTTSNLTQTNIHIHQSKLSDHLMIISEVDKTAPAERE